MILTVTLNPLLEFRFSFPSIELGSQNRNGKLNYAVGGKGINVSRQLKFLNTPSTSFTFIGGQNGKRINDLIHNEEISFTSIRTEAESRIATVIFNESEKQITYYFSANPQINEKEVDEFKNKLVKMIQNCEIVVLSGSSPCKNTDHIFPFAIEVANQYDKISILDTYGNHLNECIEASPTIIHNNKTEIHNSLNYELKDENDFLNFLQYLYSKKIKQAFITDGENDSYASNFDFHFKIKNPKIDFLDSTGSGDAFVAGIAYGIHNNLRFQDYLKLATALGSANSTKFEVCNSTFQEIEKIQEQVNITSIGKKIDLLNVQ